MLSSDAFALINKDDANADIMVQNTKAIKKTYSLRAMADFRCKVVENQFSGLLLNIDNNEVWSKLIGNFNAYNLLAVYATAVLLKEEKTNVLTTMSTLGSVEGRFQYINTENGIVGIVDYAHTPDALMNVLKTINDIRTGNEEVITLVGCGGNRDAAKRPIMAKIACDLSNKVILTSDNPRSEDPDEIIKQMQKGVDAVNYKKTLSIIDRREAIKTACSIAKAGDIILIAGKGHEKYQEIKGVKHAFDDMLVLQENLKLFAK
jgi:UDP-N-acetylmuramoyl-L-alanyl-D-glutamate--2,6-diaminopimelate ligase